MTILFANDIAQILKICGYKVIATASETSFGVS
jgi:hypothetical protein